MAEVTDAGAPAARAEGGLAVPASGASGHLRRRLRYAVVAAVLVGAVALLASQIGSSLNYFETVDQAVAQRSSLGSQTIRLEGVVVPGSVYRSADGVDFVAAGTVDRISVQNTGNPPQLFQPNIPVVVVGHFVGDSFVSNQIIVDHSAQYIEQHPGRVRAPNGTTR